MAHVLEPLADWFVEEDWPHLPCPTCAKGHLTPTVENSDSGSSKRLRAHEAWEPDWIEGTFHGTLECTNLSCRDSIAVGGDMRVNEAPSRDWSVRFTTEYRVRFIYPPLELVRLPSRTPETVRERVVAASLVLWAEPNSAANRLRAAVEELLTAQRIRKTQNRKRGSPVRYLPTQQRIELLKAKRPEVADALEAVKWIGNEGSHDLALSPTEVLAGAQLLQHALELLYDKTHEELTRMAKQINKRKSIAKATGPKTQRPR